MFAVVEAAKSRRTIGRPRKILRNRTLGGRRRGAHQMAK
jgi:hypothetical protein